ncbi:MAG: hypothetical protein IJU84_00825 [Clostridia bacterium]|nr:hypothetical protein [Clostridia bacterium]
MIGKKQRDIREDNKSVVIDLLLRSHMTLSDLEKQLGLSHTALRKVVSELMGLNIVRVIDTKTGDTGRPSAVYDINPDCGLAVAVCVGVRRLEIFVVDMKGYEINKFISDRAFANAEEMADFTEKELKVLLGHERARNAVISTVCISIPFRGVGSSSFAESCAKIGEKYGKAFSSAELIIKNNNDFWAIGEEKYGKLHNRKGSAILCEAEGSVCCTFYCEKLSYSGEEYRAGSINGLFDGEICSAAETKLCDGWGNIVRRYRSGAAEAISAIDSLTVPIFEKIGKAAFMLCVPLIIIDGSFSSLGAGFIERIKDVVNMSGADASVEFSDITDRSPSCAGAVWYSSYVSLKKLL